MVVIAIEELGRVGVLSYTYGIYGVAFCFEPPFFSDNVFFNKNDDFMENEQKRKIV